MESGRDVSMGELEVMSSRLCGRLVWMGPGSLWYSGDLEIGLLPLRKEPSIPRRLLPSSLSES